MTSATSHDRRIQDQFSRQAGTFAAVPSHSAESSLSVLLEMSGATKSDIALDVACGPGIVTCAFAPHVASIRGQDVVPQMVERARARRAELALDNASFDVGDSNALPYPDDSFDLVVTRFSFHHFSAPAQALRELARVCKPNGRVIVADVAPSPETSAAYDHFETIRDPSHTHALTEAEFDALVSAASLEVTARRRYGLAMPLEAQLAASFPEPGGREALRALFEADLGKNRLGVEARCEQGAIHFTYPVLVLRCERV